MSLIQTATAALLVLAQPDLRAEVDLAAYDEFTRNTFAEVHEMLAHQIVADYGLNKEAVLEIAFGAPYLSLALARLTLLDFHVLVQDSSQRALVETRVAEAGMSPRFTVSYGSADALPFDAGSFAMVLARDAMRFWPCKTAAFSEIDRVLKPGGIALLGGGLGRSYSDRDAAEFWARVQDWRNRTNHRPWAASLPYPEVLEASLVEAGIAEYRIWTEGGYCNCRTWVEWFKQQKTSRKEQRPRRPVPIAQPPVGSKAPDFTLTDSDGDSVRLAALRGKVVVLDFWGVDCRACLNMMDRLKPAFGSLDTSRLAVLAINIDSDRSLYEQFLGEKGTLGLRMLYDGSGVAGSYGIRGLPHFVVVGQDGAIRSRVRGSTEQNALEIRFAVERLLGLRQ